MHHRDGIAARGVRLVEQLRAHAGEAGERLDDRPQLPALSGARAGVIARDEPAEGDDEPDDLLAADLHRPAESVVRRPGKAPARQVAVAPRPRERMHVHVLVLEGDRFDQIGAPHENPARLRAADRLAAAERDEIGPVGDEPAQVLGGRERGGGVDDHRQRVPVRDPDDLIQGDAAGRVADRERHRGRALADRGFDLPRPGRAPAGIPQVADFHQVSPGDPERVRVRREVRPLDDDLVAEPGGARKPVHRRNVQSPRCTPRPPASIRRRLPR